jgi:hypothetical protein
MADSDIDIKAIMRSAQQDREDSGRLTGKYAPGTGTCRVCRGKVVAEISWPDDGLIGGPPRKGYVSGWHCEGCFIVYARCPKEPT